MKVPNQACAPFQNHWRLTPLLACTSWKHHSLSPTSCVICMVHRRALKQLSVICTFPLSDSTRFPCPQFSTSPIPHFTTLLQKVTRSHRQLRSVAMRMPWQPWWIAYWAHVSNGCNGLNFEGCEEKLHIQNPFHYFCSWAVERMDGQGGSVQNVGYFQPHKCPRHSQLGKIIPELVN